MLEAALLIILASALFVYAAYQLNYVCFLLSPVALAIVFFYSLTKRFTWASHLWLGLALSIAPIGAWLAVAGAELRLWELAVPFYLGLAVLFWLAGFDIIYSLQDREFDRLPACTRFLFGSEFAELSSSRVFFTCAP